MDTMRVAATGIVAGFDGREVLRGLDVEVPAGARMTLLGANGSGKTTLLRTIAGAHRPSAGQVFLDGEPVRFDRAGLRAHRRRVQLVLQDPDDQLNTWPTVPPISSATGNGNEWSSPVRWR